MHKKINEQDKTMVISQKRIDKYAAFLHEFEQLVGSGAKGFIAELIKIHGISAPVITVMRDMGWITGNGNSIVIHYSTPSEPIMARRLIVGLYHFNKMSVKKREAGKTGGRGVINRDNKDRQELKNVMSQYTNDKIEDETIVSQISQRTMQVPKIKSPEKKKEKSTPSVAKYPLSKEQFVPEVRIQVKPEQPKYKSKPKPKLKPKVVEVRSFGILWYKKVKSDKQVKVVICWIPVWNKKTM